MSKLESNRISRDELIKINEDDLMFITNPGRMGDEDGSTFIIRKGNELIKYRVDGLIYKNKDNDISLNDMLKQFPKWEEAWKHNNEKEYNGKYKYLYMGFGNGLSIDNNIYSEYEPFLKELVEDYLETKSKEGRESLQYAAIYNLWEDALLNMINNKKSIKK